MRIYSPAQDLVFHIFSSKMMMAARWERSPVSLKMFISAGVRGGAVEESSKRAQSSSNNKEGVFYLNSAE